MRSLSVVTFLVALCALQCTARAGYRDFRRGYNASLSTIQAASPVVTQQASSAPSDTRLSSADTPCSELWSSWAIEHDNYSYSYRTWFDTFTYHNITAPTTTLCDGHPRIIGGTDALTTIATGTNSTITSKIILTTFPTPTCSLSSGQCTGVLERHNLLCTSFTKYSRDPSDCGPCSIFGGSVQLQYFPITSNATRNLCQTGGGGGGATICPLGPTGTPSSELTNILANPCDYKTDNLTSTRNSGPYLVTGGHTFYQNRVYLSLESVYATNRCGRVGAHHTGRTLTLPSSAIYSNFGYHHEYRDEGYIYDFADAVSVPADKYYANCMGGESPTCYYNGTDYIYGRDWINGRQDIDFGQIHATDVEHQYIWQGAYTPMLLLPLQIRTLDTAWSTCDLNLGGMYDPPRILSGQLTYPSATAPSIPQTSEAAPAASVTSEGPAETGAQPSKPTTTNSEGAENEFNTPTFSFDPLPTASAGVSEGSDGGDEEDPTATAQDPAQEPGQQPQPAQTADSNSLTRTSLPSATDNGPTPADPQVPSAAPPANDDPAEQNSPPQQTDAGGGEVGQSPAPSPTNNDPAAADPQVSFPASSLGDSPAEQDPTQEQPTTNAIGGVIASILGGLPKLTTTTNALSVLESAAQSFGGGVGDPGVTDAQPSPPQETPTGQQPPEPIPITLSRGGPTQTLEPLSGSEGLYTLALPDAASAAPDDPSVSHNPELLPTQPIVLTHNDYTQTVLPVKGSSGLYTLVSPPTSEAPDQQPSHGGAISAAVPLSGPATFVADGETHTIKPVSSESGVFVIDGEQTLTQIAPPAGTSGKGGSSSQNPTGMSPEAASSTSKEAAGLPPVVTATSAQQPTSSSAAASGGNGNAETSGPAANEARRFGVDTGIMWTAAVALAVVMCIR